MGKLLLLAGLVAGSFVGTSAWALDTTKCPQNLEVSLTNISAYKTSVSSKVPGWVDARDVLKANDADRTFKMILDKVDGKTCRYLDGKIARATLLTRKLWDPEDGRFSFMDYLSVNFEIQGMKLNVYPSVEQISPRFKLHDYGRKKITVRFDDDNGKAKFYELGLTKVDAK